MDFDPEKVKKGSVAAAGLCKWVHAMVVYNRVAKVVGPKRAALAEAESTLAQAMADLGEKQAMLQVTRQKGSHIISWTSFILSFGIWSRRQNEASLERKHELYSIRIENSEPRVLPRGSCSCCTGLDGQARNSSAPAAGSREQEGCFARSGAHVLAGSKGLNAYVVTSARNHFSWFAGPSATALINVCQGFDSTLFLIYAGDRLRQQTSSGGATDIGTGWGEDQLGEVLRRAAKPIRKCHR